MATSAFRLSTSFILGVLQVDRLGVAAWGSLLGKEREYNL